MKNTKLFSIFLLLLLLSACGATNKMVNESVRPDIQSFDAASNPESSENIETEENRKLIVKHSISGDTKKYDEVLNSIEILIENFKGYITNSSEYNYGNRYFEITAKIPKTDEEKFLSELQNLKDLNITEKNKISTDVTDTYKDNELRLSSLKKRLDRLYELQKAQPSLEELLKIEKEISETTLEIENIERDLKNLNTQIDYVEFAIIVSEVGLSSTYPSKVSFSDRFNEALGKTVGNFVSGIQDAVIFLIYFLPYLVLIVVLIFIIRFLKKKFNINFKKSKKSS